MHHISLTKDGCVKGIVEGESVEFKKEGSWVMNATPLPEEESGRPFRYVSKS